MEHETEETRFNNGVFGVLVLVIAIQVGGNV